MFYDDLLIQFLLSIHRCIYKLQTLFILLQFKRNLIYDHIHCEKRGFQLIIRN
jgi:hypothetical protein